MSDSIVFEAEIDDAGKLHPVGAKAIRARLARWRGRKAWVTVAKYVKRKSNNQLAYFHGPVLDYWSEFTGYERDEMKVELKDAWLPKVPFVNRITGEESQCVPSLADLTSEQMSTFISRCVKEAALIGVNIPGPDDPPEAL